MATPTNVSVIDRWLDRELGLSDLPYISHPNFICEPGVIYSVTRDFPLAQTIWRRGGNKLRCFLLNGDMGGQTVRGHQEWMRWRVQQGNPITWSQTPGRQPHPCLIVPFSALEAASIDRSTIKPIEIREDRWTEIRHDIPHFDMKDVQWVTQPAYDQYSSYQWQTGKIPGRSDLSFQRRLENGRETYNHMIRIRGWLAVTKDKEGYFVTEQRHWLGDSVFKAKVGSRYRTFLSSFDYQETTPLYFLAEVPPGSVVNSVEDAVLALAPPIVHAAMAQERAVKRQGDMFAIPTSLTTADVKARTNGKIQRMQGVLGTDHVATESYVGKGRVTYARGNLFHKPQGRRPDHLICRLGKEWHLVVPNAVPRRRRGLQVRV